MEPIVKNLVYRSVNPLLAEEEMRLFIQKLRIMREKQPDKTMVVFLGEDSETVSKFSKRIMELDLPKWIDKDGNVWIPHDVSPQFHMCHYKKGGNCGKHLDKRFCNNEVSTEQFKLLVYLNDAKGDTQVYYDQENYVCSSPKAGYAVYYHLDLIHTGELVETDEKMLIGFRIRYKKSLSGDRIPDLPLLEEESTTTSLDS